MRLLLILQTRQSVSAMIVLYQLSLWMLDICNIMLDNRTRSKTFITIIVDSVSVRRYGSISLVPN